MNKNLWTKLAFGAAVTAMVAAPLAIAEGDSAQGKRGHRGMDANRDGKITLEEALSARPELTEEKFADRDTNGDGVWTAEDRRGRGPRGEGRPGMRRGPGGPGGPEGPGGPAFGARFEDADTDGDNKISLEEFKAAHPAVKEIFERIDRNGDGYLTEDERPGRGGPAGMHRSPRDGQGPRGPEGRSGYGPRDGQGLRGPEGRGGYGPRGPEGRRGGFDGPPPRERMEQADTNQDGKITLEEATAALPGMNEEKFNWLDRNGDGVLTPEDRPEHGRGGPGHGGPRGFGGPGQGGPRL
jgi:hypothetical protein